MDTYMIVLRLIHIVTGIFWIGSDLLMLFFVEPNAVALGPNGAAFMRRLTMNTRYTQAMPISALLTVVSGFLLYAQVSGDFNRDWIVSSSGLTMTIGSMAGVIAFMEGMVVIDPTVHRVEKLGTTMSEQQGPPTGDQLDEMDRLQTRLNYAYRVMIVLAMLSLAGMSASRYIWS